MKKMNLNKLPDFIIIGATRCGTTSLFWNLIKHPYINGPLNNIKEVHFFDIQYERGLDWYNNCFPERGKNMVHLEATPNYFYNANIPQRIKKLMPKTRFIIMLRNPIDRTWSDFWVLSKEHKNISQIHKLMNPKIRLINKSVYIRHLKKWFEYFAEDSFLILKSEEFFQDEHTIIKKCFKWMNLNPIKIDELIYGYGRYGLFKPPAKDKYSLNIPKNIFFWLKEYFESYNKELYSFIGRDFGWKEEKAKYGKTYNL